MPLAQDNSSTPSDVEIVSAAVIYIETIRQRVADAKGKDAFIEALNAYVLRNLPRIANKTLPGGIRNAP
jgi:hypothetical protein